jgi:prepilin-type N-terminal cleavage/methylation domain-containing protein
MNFRNWRRLYRDQRGFTVLEMLVTLFLTALISLGASMACAQVLNQTSRNSNYTTAGRQALNAIFWISRDAQMAQTVTGDDVFPDEGDLTLGWTTWENQQEQVVYSLSDGELRRWYSNDGDPVETVVAEYISADPELTSCVSDGGVLSLKITASVSTGGPAASVTRTHDTTSRPKL